MGRNNYQGKDRTEMQTAKAVVWSAVHYSMIYTDRLRYIMDPRTTKILQ